MPVSLLLVPVVLNQLHTLQAPSVHTIYIRCSERDKDIKTGRDPRNPTKEGMHFYDSIVWQRNST